jgi:hypothetical protein
MLQMTIDVPVPLVCPLIFFEARGPERGRTLPGRLAARRTEIVLTIGERLSESPFIHDGSGQDKRIIGVPGNAFDSLLELSRGGGYAYESVLPHLFAIVHGQKRDEEHRVLDTVRRLPAVR